MRRTAARLADGREIIYFDAEATAPSRQLEDPRDLGPITTASEIRYDAVLDEWVAIASHRQGRTHLPPTDECPLCPSRGRAATPRSRPTTTTSWSSRTASRPSPRASTAGGPPAASYRPRRGPGDDVFARGTGCRPLRGRVLHQRPRLADQSPAARARTPGRGRPGRPHRRAVGAAPRRAGLLLREPRRGDRRHAGPPPRPDLRLPVRHAPDPAHARLRAAAPGAHLAQPVRRRAGGRAGRRVPGGRGQRALGGVRAVGGALAGRDPPLPASPGAGPPGAQPRRSATTSPRSTSRCSAPWTVSTAPPCPTSRPGTRRPSGWTATCPTCTCRCSR